MATNEVKLKVIFTYNEEMRDVTDEMKLQTHWTFIKRGKQDITFIINIMPNATIYTSLEEQVTDTVEW